MTLLKVITNKEIYRDKTKKGNGRDEIKKKQRKTEGLYKYKGSQ